MIDCRVLTMLTMTQLINLKMSFGAAHIIEGRRDIKALPQNTINFFIVFAKHY